MKRKLVQQGPSTLMVSLPISWVKANNLKKGDEVEIKEEDKWLQLFAREYQKPYEKRYFDFEKVVRLTERIINSCYRKGIDEIQIKFPNSDVFHEIQNALQEVVGFEIVEQTENTCVLKSVSSSGIEEFDAILRRMFLMLMEMSELILDALQKKEFDRLQEIKLLEITNNRFSAFLRRLLNKSVYKDRITTVQLYILSRDLEKIADQYKHICTYCYKNKIILTKESAQLFDEINKYVRHFYNLFYDNNLEKIQQFVLQKDKLMQKCLELIDKAILDKNRNMHVIHNLTNILQITFDLVSLIFVLTL